MKSILVIVLILLVLGLYFFTEPTKGLIRVTGKATVHAAAGIAKEMANSSEFKEIKSEVINQTKNKIGGVK